ncbi:MAG: lectin-like domain-containing protein [Verrucomicrobiia bacterium]
MPFAVLLLGCGGVNLASSRLRGIRVTAGVLLLVFTVSARAQYLYSETFRETTAPGWILAGDDPGTPAPVLTAAQGIDPSGNGWLRLTSNANNQSAYAFLNSAIRTPSSFSISFEYAMWNGSGADGISFFLFDATTPSPSPGSFGGSLGYAQRTGMEGVAGGWLGVGLDNFGNFSNPTEGRIGGPGFIPNSITVRGSGNSTTGYNYLAMANLDSIGQMDFPTYTTRPVQTGVDYRKVNLDFSSNNTLTVTMQFGAAGTPQTLISSYNLNTASNQVARPELLGIGFAAATGGSTDIHEIRNLVITSSLPLVPELSSWLIAVTGLGAAVAARWLAGRCRNQTAIPA